MPLRRGEEKRSENREGEKERQCRTEQEQEKEREKQRQREDRKQSVRLNTVPSPNTMQICKICVSHQPIKITDCNTNPVDLKKIKPPHFLKM